MALTLLPNALLVSLPDSSAATNTSSKKGTPVRIGGRASTPLTLELELELSLPYLSPANRSAGEARPEEAIITLPADDDPDVENTDVRRDEADADLDVDVEREAEDIDIDIVDSRDDLLVGAPGTARSSAGMGIAEAFFALRDGCPGTGEMYRLDCGF
ncbi:uncharacterized protein RCO7_04389 [Rhynchosporium graminicola]|uniref:Uncharacterized protein n=1 Tax=Rhynchosporium graminicola TaxID=2792576 RepID=A0A1E1JRM3_9HELO|nr:uncharacterized protein RCO7_04389 [Rhynchosporium commune]